MFSKTSLLLYLLLGLSIVAVFRLPKSWYSYLFPLIFICYLNAFSFQLLKIVLPTTWWGKACLYTLLIVICIALFKALILFYQASLQADNLKVYAMEYIIFTGAVIITFAINFCLINVTAESLIAQQTKLGSDKSVIDHYVQWLGFISESRSMNFYQRSLQFYSSFFDMLYFSTISYLTIGYGDYLPVGMFTRLLVLLEVFLGHISTTIVLVVGVTKIIKKY